MTIDQVEREAYAAGRSAERMRIADKKEWPPQFEKTCVSPECYKVLSLDCIRAWWLAGVHDEAREDKPECP